MNMSIEQALHALTPKAEWVLRGTEIEWLDTEQTQPTDSEIQAEITRLQAEYDSKQYARDRAKDYAPLADQLDMLWHAIDQGIDLKQSDFYTGNKAVKDAHPKG